jgi:toxin-antitoxin system PIN domain toxin
MTKASSETLLLDINVLLAIAWPNHQFHAVARQRLESSSVPWATCALTQLGFIRLSSNPAIVASPKSPLEAVMMLSSMTEDPLHVYYDSLPAPAKSHDAFEGMLGGKQVTDAYLLLLARRNHATFLTFDSRLKALARGKQSVEVLGL